MEKSSIILVVIMEDFLLNIDTEGVYIKTA